MLSTCGAAVRDINNVLFRGDSTLPVMTTPVFVLSSLVKVMQDDITCEGNSSADISLAKNETQSFQIIIANKGESPIPKIDLAVSGWQNGSSMYSPTITLYREHYVKTKQSSGNSHKKVGAYPDALIPLVDPYTGKEIVNAKYLARNQDVKAKTSQGYWIDVTVGSSVPAGTYSNTITVLSDKNILASIPVKLTVWDFELPAVPPLKSWFNLVPEVSSYHNVSKTSRAYSTIEKRYMMLLRQHGAVPAYSAMPRVDSQTGAITFTPKYIQGLRDFINQIQPLSLYLNSCFIYKPTAPAKPTQLARYLSDWQKFVEQNPWIPEPYLLYDEPQTVEAYRQVIDYGKAIHQYAPSIKFLVTTQVEPKLAGFPSFEGYVDIWCPIWFLGNPDSMARRQKLGEKMWSYIALTQSEDVPTWLIDFPLLDYRIPGWFSWTLELEGILYWHTMSWAVSKPMVDPWTESATCVINTGKWNGEGSLVYPGGAAGIDGPVASMRLKAYRDGVQDYDYLYLLSQLIGKDETKKISSAVAKDFKTYSKNPNDYLNARKQLADRILSEKAKRAAAATK